MVANCFELKVIPIYIIFLEILVSQSVSFQFRDLGQIILSNKIFHYGGLGNGSKLGAISVLVFGSVI